MQTTIDSAGRVVIPKALRDQIGLEPGPVDVVVAGAAIRIEPIVADGGIAKVGGRLVIAASGTAIDDAGVDELRRADQR